MIEIKEINGKPHVRAKDLKPNPKNEEIYTQSALEAMIPSFRKRINGCIK